MKKILFLFLLISSILAEAQTFVASSPTGQLSGVKIYIYENGIRIDSKTTNSNGEAVFNLTPNKTYTYQTDSNFLGTFSTDTSTIQLQHAEYKIIVTNEQNEPRSGIQSIIYFQGKETRSKSTNASGEVSFLLKPSCNYAYRVHNRVTGVVTTDETSLQETIPVQIKTVYRVDFIASYNNLPVKESFRLTSNGGSFSNSDSSSSSNGLFGFNLLPGSYTITSDLGGRKNVEVIDQNLTIPLDFKKITFKNVDTNLNLLNTITIENIDNRFRSDLGYFDAKKEVTCFLLPGTYKYKFAGSESTFDVVEDAIIEIETKQIEITLRNLETGSVYPSREFYVNSSNGQTTKYTTDASGKINIPLAIGQYKVLMTNNNDGPAVDFTVSTTTTAIDIPLLDFQVNVNTSIPNFRTEYSLEFNGFRISSSYKFGQTYTLPPASYQITWPFDLSFDLDTANEIITKSISRLIINLNTVSGENVVSDMSYTIKEVNTGFSDSFFSRGGKTIEETLPNGSYVLKNELSFQEWNVEILDGDVVIDDTLPNIVSFTITRNGVTDNDPFVVMYENEIGFIGPIIINKDRKNHHLDVGDIKRINSGFDWVDYQIQQNNVLDFVEFNVSTQGKGLAFPPASNKEVRYSILKGSPVTLSAVPMKGWVFQKWVINGTDILNDQIEYTPTGLTTAKAVFVADNGTLDVADQELNDVPKMALYPNPASDVVETKVFVEGTVKIYDLKGNVVKDTYMLGKKLNVSNLNTGAYIISFELDNGSNFTGKFVKQ